ncbi:multisubunit sodium/proton antiporter, MrpC subunit (TC 2.A.63.1) [Dethiosulfatibacter aminovorans DSM 17477]|uniref:Multisubunit sodium/proton antiporter, MrpC subunit (TC 2.A.63.1) n=1 Tax=Dethiosulfatibacter aminovorans DSM 17477 TaxID=1121476 RepID=A0A1M6GS87_9FIRM|nr:cation:proton antiporter subunit C [Dethiosulfatibacter aminovorans]SHJ12855.1 multisubunit sodium/proton antiporter, MrpC subunit (TC 2.A.63.1) [Dethiosulfatibacter aminovorans DSM 17477]
MIERVSQLTIEYINGENISLVLFFVGIYGLSARRNILKSIISLGIVQAAIILFFVSMDADSSSVPPIGKSFSQIPSDPVPQALMITAVVIGISVTAVSLTMFISLYRKYGTTNWSKARRKREDMK